MPKVLFSLQQQFSDLRSNEIAYEFKIENQGAGPINLLSIIPRIPDKVELIEVKSPSLSAAKEKHRELCEQLTELLKDHVKANSVEAVQKQVQVEVDILKQTLGSLGGLLGLYGQMFTGTLAKNIKQKRLLSEVLFLKVDSRRDAETGFNQFLQHLPDGDIRKTVFVAKVEQLVRLEGTLGADGVSEPLAVVEPDSFFAMTYILKFPRSVADPKKYNISIETAYGETGKNERHIGGTTTTLIISARPEILTMIAVISSLLGATLRLATYGGSMSAGMVTFGQIRPALIGWPALTAAITALVFFNIYEFTALGDKFKMSVGWRGALLIGFLCGLSGDRILAALKAFAGG